MLQELLEQEAANTKPIEDLIEEERSKVDAKTPITEVVRLTPWHSIALQLLCAVHLHEAFPASGRRSASGATSGARRSSGSWTRRRPIASARAS